MNSAKRRLMMEYRDIRKHVIETRQKDESKRLEIILRPKDESNMLRWTAYLRGPRDTPFEEHYFQLRISVPSKYPLEPPKIVFVTKIFHPNIHYKTGEICLDVLKSEWSPVWTLESTCRAIQSLMEAPAEDSPLNCDAGNLLRAGDAIGFRSLARMYTLDHGIADPPDLYADEASG